MPPRKKSLRNVEDGPPLVPLGEIDMGLVDKARAEREATGGTIPVGDAATELIRLLRTEGAFGGKKTRNNPAQQKNTPEPPNDF